MSRVLGRTITSDYALRKYLALPLYNLTGKESGRDSPADGPPMQTGQSKKPIDAVQPPRGKGNTSSRFYALIVNAL